MKLYISIDVQWFCLVGLIAYGCRHDSNQLLDNATVPCSVTKDIDRPLVL